MKMNMALDPAEDVKLARGGSRERSHRSLGVPVHSADSTVHGVLQWFREIDALEQSHSRWGRSGPEGKLPFSQEHPFCRAPTSFSAVS